MRRYMLLVIACLVMTGISCNLGASTADRPSPGPAPEIPETTETQLPPIEAASTALAQYSATLTAEAPPSTPTPDSGVICLLAFEDLNGNTMHDETEGVLQDVRFVLQHDRAEVEALFRTSEGGPFCLAELPPGDYVIRAFPPISFGGTLSGEMSIRLAAGETVQVAIGFVETGRPDGRLELDGRHPAAILASDTRGDTLYLAAAQTLYRSEDGGQSWESVGEQPPAANMVASPAEPSVLYAGGDLECFRGESLAPLFISQDGGATWNESPDGTGLRPAAAHPADRAVAWAIGCDGPYLTEDGGLTWQHQPADAWGLYTLDEIRPVGERPRILYATGNSEGGSGALFRSQDGGHAWRLATDEPDLWISALLLRPDAAEEVWFATPAGVWHSLDGGDMWEVSRAGLEEVAVGDDYLFENRGLHVLARAKSGTLYLGTEQGIFQSGDGGLNWRPLSGPPWAHEPISQVVVTDAWSETRLWVTAASGVYLYTPQVP